MIHALGLAPSLDVVYTVPAVTPGEIHRPTTVSRLPGGKSLNVARALARLGHRVRALAPLGGRLGDLVAEGLEGTGVELVRLATTVPTRMCVSVADVGAGTLTEFYENAPVADGGELDALERALRAVHSDDWLVLSGSVPEGTDLARFVELLAACRRRGTRLAVDTHGPVLPLLIAEARPDLVKINRSEAVELVGGGADQLLVLGQSVRALGSQVLVLTDGADGALGWDGTGVWRVTTDAPPGGYPVGSGDCFLAGLVGELSLGRGLADAFVTAAATGAANAATPGGALFDEATLSDLRRRTKVAPARGVAPR